MVCTSVDPINLITSSSSSMQLTATSCMRLYLRCMMLHRATTVTASGNCGGSSPQNWGGVQCSKVQSIRGLLGCPSIDAHLDPHCQKVRGSGRHEPEPPQDCRHFYRPNPMKHTKKWGSVHIWTSHCQKVRGSGRHKPGPPVPTGSPPALGPIPNVPCAEGT